MTDSPSGGGRIRAAVPADVPQIMQLIRDLAEYEHEPDAVTADEDDLHRVLFSGADVSGGRPAVFCEVVVDDTADAGVPGGGDRVLGMALWFVSFSTWEGRHGIYLEDLYVRPEARGRGFGRALLSRLAALCVERGYARLEWSVLDWNAPAIDFYRSQGATAQDGWTVHRVSGSALATLAR
jgi:GNAT superfamily N-acetyltransferase